jgi:hypothetical protein
VTLAILEKAIKLVNKFNAVRQSLRLDDTTKRNTLGIVPASTIWNATFCNCFRESAKLSDEEGLVDLVFPPGIMMSERMEIGALASAKANNSCDRLNIASKCSSVLALVVNT